MTGTSTSNLIGLASLALVAAAPKPAPSTEPAPPPAVEPAQQPAPADAARRVVLGVVLTNVDGALAEQLDLDASRTVMIENVIDGSGAADAGLQRYDVITHVNGAAPATNETIRRALTGLADGDTVELGLIRGGKPRTVRVTVHEAPEDFLIEVAPAPSSTPMPGERWLWAPEWNERLGWAQAQLGESLEEAMRRTEGLELRAQRIQDLVARLAGEAAIVGERVAVDVHKALEEQLPGMLEDSLREAGLDPASFAPERLQRAVDRASAILTEGLETGFTTNGHAALGARVERAQTIVSEALRAVADELDLSDTDAQALADAASGLVRRITAIDFGLSEESKQRLRSLLDELNRLAPATPPPPSEAPATEPPPTSPAPDDGGPIAMNHSGA